MRSTTRESPFSESWNGDCNHRASFSIVRCASTVTDRLRRSSLPFAASPLDPRNEILESRNRHSCGDLFNSLYGGAQPDNGQDGDSRALAGAPAISGPPSNAVKSLRICEARGRPSTQQCTAPYTPQSRPILRGILLYLY
jgi:hypothetical protein